MSTYTEAEAKSKWCPFVRIVNGKIHDDRRTEHVAMQAPFNRIVDGAAWSAPVGGCCTGSSCMAWRWGQKRNPDWKPPAMYGMGGFTSHPADEAPAYVTDHERGYCGLAGRPS